MKNGDLKDYISGKRTNKPRVLLLEFPCCNGNGYTTVDICWKSTSLTEDGTPLELSDCHFCCRRHSSIPTSRPAGQQTI
jgi:hypothetical protein